MRDGDDLNQSDVLIMNAIYHHRQIKFSIKTSRVLPFEVADVSPRPQ
jgi:hypothetical protein